MPDELRAPFQKPHLERGRHRGAEAPERPYLTLQLSGRNGGSQKLRGIVDSGADYTCLPLSIAKALGYRNADLRGRAIQQVSGEILEDCQPLWGRADFFAAFDRVAFEGQTLVLITR